MFFLIPFVVISQIFQCCNNKLLTVQTEYLSHENLASFHVGTPDPRLRNPPLGQRLIINWSLPKWNGITPYDLSIQIRFKNGTSANEQMTLNKSSGTYVFSLLNQEYFNRGGFKTYVATISSNGQVIEEWRHQLWANLIEIQEEHGDDDEGGEENGEEEGGSEEESVQESYDQHYKGEGGIQKDSDDPDQAQYKYYF